MVYGNFLLCTFNLQIFSVNFLHHVLEQKFKKKLNEYLRLIL
jgi:hypothetical protein